MSTPSTPLNLVCYFSYQTLHFSKSWSFITSTVVHPPTWTFGSISHTCLTLPVSLGNTSDLVLSVHLTHSYPYRYHTSVGHLLWSLSPRLHLCRVINPVLPYSWCKKAQKEGTSFIKGLKSSEKSDNRLKRYLRVLNMMTNEQNGIGNYWE